MNEENSITYSKPASMPYPVVFLWKSEPVDRYNADFYTAEMMNGMVSREEVERVLFGLFRVQVKKVIALKVAHINCSYVGALGYIPALIFTI